MKEMYNNYKKEISKRNNILVLILVIFIIGLIFGSIYITILSNDQKLLIMNKVSNFFKTIPKIKFEDKIDIFKNSLYSNLLCVSSIWILGISIIGIPMVFVIMFFKSFILSFSISSIFAKYGFKGIVKVLIYLFPSNIIFTIFILFLSTYSIIISSNIFLSAFKKETINFKLFMGKYLFLLVIGVLISILCALYDAFINPFIYQMLL